MSTRSEDIGSTEIVRIPCCCKWNSCRRCLSASLVFKIAALIREIKLKEELDLYLRYDSNKS